MLATASIAIFTLDAAKQIHDNMLMRVMRAPMHFFESNPLGRILNRFSKDIDVIDCTLPMNLRTLANQLLNVFSTILVIMIAMPIFVVIVIPLAGFYYFLRYLSLEA